MTLATDVHASHRVDVPSGDAADTLLHLGGALPGVPLDEVNASAGLQTRTDHKYVVSPALLPRLLASGDWRVLEVGRRRLSAYESLYFDTDDLQLFRAHRQGRRRRYKVRLRRYLDAGESMLEVKTKGRRGSTVKHRRPRACDHALLVEPTQHDAGVARGSCWLTLEERRFVESVVDEQYGLPVPVLRRSLVTRYRRMTFVDLVAGERLTCDVGLSFEHDGRIVRSPDVVVLESKVASRTGRADRALLSLGVRPICMSKYAVGTALLHPDLAANRWNSVLRRHFAARIEGDT